MFKTASQCCRIHAQARFSRGYSSHPCDSPFGAAASSVQICSRQICPCPLTLPSLLVGNIPDCVQHQKRKSKPWFDLDVKSTFEPPSEEWSKGNQPWTADLGVTRRDPRKAVPPAK
ncbi:hypothetical protein DVQ84_08180 [Yersinia enterocolitica]|nr:hypothetical protein [Yersinia enterocolitica]EKN6031300.1 hypothetical protein [Yersinia enterocolitica]EKN6069653.1 hypothetical protein [Yersinia enterocolitica]EKN6185117.1 hypothetical protein [Yersinia enterocolitica]EKN6188111.1 hypothetical protein [Yersinia enterocolitica]